MAKRVLFVCLGNICRSPLAEAIFNHQSKLSGFEFYSDSCGTANYHVGDSPDTRTIQVAQKNGVFIEHLGRQLSIEDIDRYDLILTMDSSNYRNTLKVFSRESESKVKMLRDFDPQGRGDVPDPYYGTMRDFDEVFMILDRSIREVIRSLKDQE